MAALRADLQLGLVESAERNRNAGVERIALFEVARVFLPSGEELPHEPWHVAGIVEGGFYRAKGAVEAVYRVLKVEPELEPGEGRAAKTPDGIVRELAGGWGYFELDLDSLFERVPELPLYEDVITFPAVKQDLAFAVDEEVSAAALVSAAREAAGPELREMIPFDVYRGEQVRATDASRSRSASSSARPSVRSPTTTPRGCARGSSRHSASASAPSSGLRGLTLAETLPAE